MDHGRVQQVASEKIGEAWLSRVRPAEGPIYLAIVRALSEAVREGELQPGDRLPAQRAVAERLGVDLTTVTRAYAAARDRGLLESTVGRGAFVRAPASDDDQGLVDLSMNLPPPPHGLSLGALLRDATGAILQRADPAILMAYHPGFGTLGQRTAGAGWLAPTLGAVDPQRVLVSPGAQAALAAILATVCRPGDAVVVEALTYPGFLAAARRLGLRLLPCPTDAEGLVPEALEDLCRRERPKALYLVPTMQNPTAVTLPLARREAVARIAASAGLWMIEDDPYSRLMTTPPPALASLAPGRTYHIATLAKCLSPGLRIAYVVCPDGQVAGVADALRATALMPAPLMAAVATTWIREGDAERLLAAVREEARARREIAARLLPDAVGAPESIHIWLPLARSAEQLRRSAQERGLALVTAEAFAAGDPTPNGVRISLGGAARRAMLEAALRSIRDLLGAPSGRDRLIV
jgi:DNA-binding transcriptional MocR family regulator